MCLCRCVSEVPSDRPAAHYRVMRQRSASNSAKTWPFSGLYTSTQKCEILGLKLSAPSVGKQIYEKDLHPAVLSAARGDDSVRSPSRQAKDGEGESRSWSKSDVFQNVVGTV